LQATALVVWLLGYAPPKHIKTTELDIKAPLPHTQKPKISIFKVDSRLSS